MKVVKEIGSGIVDQLKKVGISSVDALKVSGASVKKLDSSLRIKLIFLVQK